MTDVSHELGSLRMIVDSPLSSKVAMFNNQVSQHKQSQHLNPFSQTDGRASPKPTFSKDEYGKPLAGSLTEMRGQKANIHVLKEMLELCQIIDSEGYVVKDEPEMRVIPFGELFNIYNYISDKVVGILLRARKHKLVEFEGEMLFQRRDDNVPVFLLRPIQTIRKELNEKIECVKSGVNSAPQATSVLLDKSAHQQKLQESKLLVPNGSKTTRSRTASPSNSKHATPAHSKQATPAHSKQSSPTHSKQASPAPEIKPVATIISKPTIEISNDSNAKAPVELKELVNEKVAAPVSEPTVSADSVEETKQTAEPKESEPVVVNITSAVAEPTVSTDSTIENRNEPKIIRPVPSTLNVGPLVADTVLEEAVKKSTDAISNATATETLIQRTEVSTPTPTPTTTLTNDVNAKSDINNNNNNNNTAEQHLPTVVIEATAIYVRTASTDTASEMSMAEAASETTTNNAN